MTTASSRTGRAVPVADAIFRSCAVLTPAERFALSVEAMARRDDADPDRLEDSCPKLTSGTTTRSSGTGCSGRT
jgi:hypothetical protein